MHITKYLAGMRWEFFAVAWIFFIFGCRYQNQTNDAIDQWHTEVHYVRYMHIGYRLPSIYHPFLMLYCWCYANQNLIVNIAGDFFFFCFWIQSNFLSNSMIHDCNRKITTLAIFSSCFFLLLFGGHYQFRWTRWTHNRGWIGSVIML